LGEVDGEYRRKVAGTGQALLQKKIHGPGNWEIKDQQSGWEGPTKKALSNGRKKEGILEDSAEKREKTELRNGNGE